MRNKLFTLISIIIFFGVSCLQTSFANEYKLDDLSGQKFETERLIITKTTDEDLEPLSEYLLNNKDVTKYFSLDPRIKNGFKTKEEALEFLTGKATDSLEFTIKLKENNKPIGKLDFLIWGSLLCIGNFWLVKDFQGKGYMSEACFEVCNKVFNASDVEGFCIYLDLRNQDFVKVIKKTFNYIEKENSTMSLSRTENKYDFKETLNDEEFLFHYIHCSICKKNWLGW